MYIWKRFRVMWSVIFLLCVILAFSGCSRETDSSSPQQDIDQETKQKLEQLDRTADEMYKKVYEGDVVQGREMLLELGKQVIAIRFENVTSIEGVAALNQSIVSANRIFNDVKFSMSDGQIAAAQIRMATDALTHLQHPMWLQYYKVLNEDLSRMEAAFRGDRHKEALELLEQMELHYSIIQPAVMISREPSEAGKIKSLFVFMRMQLSAEKPDATQVQSGIMHFHEQLNLLFQKEDQSAYIPMIEPQRPVLWTLGIGSFIMMALVYAGWRMYEFNRNIAVIRRNRDE